MEKSKLIKLHYALWYFILFSVAGLIIEMSYGYATMGIIESRKGLFLGPFCPIYGVGGALLIFILDKFKNNKLKLFIYGGIIGSVLEYVLSFILEAFYGARFWDYGYVKYNINGRICIIYSLFWAILSVVIIKLIKPRVDKIIEKIPRKKIKVLDIGVTIFLILDVIITVWAITTYQTRVLNDYYGVTVQRKETIITKIEDNWFSNEKMLLTFPNLRARDEHGNEIFIRNILEELNNK